MELFEYFTQKSRELGTQLNAEGFRERKMVNPRKAQQQTGILTRLDFDGFKIIVTFIYIIKLNFSIKSHILSVFGLSKCFI